MWDEDCVLKIEKMENGFQVNVIDEDIVANNQKPKSSYKSPWKSYGFNDVAAVVEFITKKLSTLKKPPKADAEYAGAFAEATTGDEK
jgi:hypothetical protein